MPLIPQLSTAGDIAISDPPRRSGTIGRKMPSIAAVVLCGASIPGGRGSHPGAVAGVIPVLLHGRAPASR